MSDTTQPAGLLADLISRSTLSARLEEERTQATRLEAQAGAHLRLAEQLAAQAQAARIRADLLAEILAEQKTAPD